MSDVFTKQKRSEIMSKVKSSRNSSTELKMIGVFKEYKIIGWRRNYKIKGKPDFVFPKLKIAVFTDGCFWHGHDCRNTKPQDNKEYWSNKISKNKNRDKNVTDYLIRKGWAVIRIWECELKKKNLQKLLEKISVLMASGKDSNQIGKKIL